MSSNDEQAPESVWCLVANVREEIPFGEGGRETRCGTRLLRAGAKVHCYPVCWGDGYEKIKVIARHRASGRWITTVLARKALTNFRAKRVYDPYVVRRIANSWTRVPDFEAFLMRHLEPAEELRFPEPKQTPSRARPTPRSHARSSLFDRLVDYIWKRKNP
ncbi:MAG: hypothetical protein H6819_01585 [Phycisphaerales bacterium]|nr:hypothetical protein [Phycisphaerales bacterium]MCB9857099.1 hypothetical protein [Phycisphaerales bacterium]MCB9861774.1 hypothetical protein [Phycisphaerales bacterium]